MIIKSESKTVVTEITITMSPEEAVVLREIAYVIGGNPSGPRGVIDRLDAGLKKAGIKRTGGANAISGSAHFTESS